MLTNERSPPDYLPRQKTRKPSQTKKTRSYLDITDRKTHEVKRFTFSRNLGEGSYGYVRLFVNGDEKIAVKALKEFEPKNDQDSPREELHHMSKATLAEWQNEAENEMALLKASYPDEKYYSLRHYHEREKGTNGYTYDCRMTMPFIPGMKLSEFAARGITTPEQMARLMLRVAQELQRLHTEAGVIHGDAGARNIMATKEGGDYIIRFLDFGLAYRADGYAKVNFSKGATSDTSSADMAPERYQNRRLRARPVQDVYSLAKTFWKLVKRREEQWKADFLCQYPVISQFINNGILDWKERPELSGLIYDLECNLDWKAHLPKKLNPLIKSLDQADYSRAFNLLQNHRDTYTDEELAQLLYQLVLNQECEIVHELMNMKKKIHLNELVSGNTCMHEAAMTGNLDMVLTLLRHQPDLLIKNSDGDLAVDVAQENVESVLRLFTYIQKSERDIGKANKSRLFDKTRHNKCSHLLAAARVLGHAVLDDDNDRHHNEIKEHLGVIKNSPELNDIYLRLTEENIINKKGEALHGILSYISSYF